MHDKSPDHSNVITLHFDVPVHSIPSDQFVDCVEGTYLILNNLNRVFYGDSQSLELYILPAEEGGFKLKIVVQYVTLTIITALLSSAFDGFVKGISGKNIAEHVEAIFSGDTQEELNETQKIQKVRDYILTKCAVEFLAKDQNSLQKIGITEDIYREALEGKNKFYNACIRNEAVTALGFDDSYNFPVKKENFSEHTKTLRPIEIDGSEMLYSEVFELEIHSPNSYRKAKLKWGAILNNIPVTFDMNDEDFWEEINKENVFFTSNLQDRATIQCIYNLNDGKIKNIKAVRVISYNGKEFFEPLSDEELQRRYFVEKGCKREDQRQLPLFD